MVQLLVSDQQRVSVSQTYCCTGSYKNSPLFLKTNSTRIARFARFVKREMKKFKKRPQRMCGDPPNQHGQSFDSRMFLAITSSQEHMIMSDEGRFQKILRSALVKSADIRASLAKSQIRTGPTNFYKCMLAK
jgi:hypothetical protein